ncbi:uncharacterized protein Pyn_11828 [Prunus yedoensis var. nudiflora]|uniref:Uncharacterized protein n=1 Tax=Prunus yedoensis var. nudiflora TaxID=2094558 RepID=A0A314YEU6_PRUYE|nr:uncharacterized protein Pyn_23025 [Prunus yedoensis var. nudiflora]PQQ02938.1 uncharacterized protein Pyn_11828 [Prunus yedoensis var. nudiflora]
MSDRGDQPFPIVATGGPQRMLVPLVVATRLILISTGVQCCHLPQQYPILLLHFHIQSFLLGAVFLCPQLHLQGFSQYLDSSSAGRFGYSAVRSQLLGPAAMISSNYPRPYVVNLPDGSNNSSGESTRKWGRQGLDLNAGPGGPDLEGRDVTSPLAPRQLSVAGSQALAEEHVRMFQMQGGPFKRKEPEGGWDGYKQSSWK